MAVLVLPRLSQQKICFCSGNHYCHYYHKHNLCAHGARTIMANCGSCSMLCWKWKLLKQDFPVAESFGKNVTKKKKKKFSFFVTFFGNLFVKLIRYADNVLESVRQFGLSGEKVKWDSFVVLMRSFCWFSGVCVCWSQNVWFVLCCFSWLLRYHSTNLSKSTRSESLDRRVSQIFLM